MSYQPFKKQSKVKVELRKLKDFDLYFEQVPPTTVYKLQRAMNRRLRKLKLA